MKRITIAVLAFVMTATFAFAQQRGVGRPDGGPGGGHLIVASDGTVLVTRTVTDSATDTSTTTLTAITSSGTQAWSVTLTDRGQLTLSGSNILSIAEGVITARSLATGAVAWTLTVTGHVTDLEPFSGGTYAVVVAPPATEGGTATRTLIAISSSGAELWRKAL